MEHFFIVSTNDCYNEIIHVGAYLTFEDAKKSAEKVLSGRCRLTWAGVHKVKIGEHKKELVFGDTGKAPTVMGWD